MDTKGLLLEGHALRCWENVLGKEPAAVRAPGVERGAPAQAGMAGPLEGTGSVLQASEKKANDLSPETGSGKAQPGQRLSKPGRL